MTDRVTLTIDIRGYWHSGTGRGSGSHLDAVVDTAHDDLPYLSGRHLKGLLRDAVHRAETWSQLDGLKSGRPEASFTELLFGKRYDDPETRVPRDETTQGLLRIGDASLPAELRAWLAQRGEKRKYAAHLYRDISSTAIESAAGVAKSRSLRGIQVTVPLRLEAVVETLPPLREPSPADAVLTAQWPVILDFCLPLVRAVGAHRGRGLGRARLQLSTETAA